MFIKTALIVCIIKHEIYHQENSDITSKNVEKGKYININIVITAWFNVF